MSPGFVSHMKGMVQGWLDEAKASKKEKDASTPKSRNAAGRGGAGRRAVDGGASGSPLAVAGMVGMIRQVRKRGVDGSARLDCGEVLLLVPPFGVRFLLVILRERLAGTRHRLVREPDKVILCLFCR